MKNLKPLSIASAMVLLSNISYSQEVSYPIVGTNQTLFFDNSTTITAPAKGDAFYGQDAHFQHNRPSYTDNQDGTITDNITGLVWQKEFQVMSYEEALAAAKKCRLAGKTDWRVPTIKEAYSLITFDGRDASGRDMSRVPEGAIPFLDTRYFSFEYGSNGTRVIDTQLLSNTFNISSSARQRSIFGVNIADGRIKCYPLNTREGGKRYTVRFVRGAAYGENEFVDNDDNTISDRATGLMWGREDSGRGMSWEEALRYAERMNRESYLGYNDWRVPNIKELQSIVDYSRSPDVTSSPALDPLFESTTIRNEGGERDYPFYWSSTTHCTANLRNIGSSAAYICFGRGMGNMPRGGGVSANWINIHGAGSQRSDPKRGDADRYAGGRGPQGDAIRIENFVRLVRSERGSGSD